MASNDDRFPGNTEMDTVQVVPLAGTTKALRQKSRAPRDSLFSAETSEPSPLEMVKGTYSASNMREVVESSKVKYVALMLL